MKTNKHSIKFMLVKNYYKYIEYSYSKIRYKHVHPNYSQSIVIMSE